MQVLGPFTSNLFVVSVISHRQDKQWLWEIPEVALEMGFRISHVRNDAMTHHKKHRDGMDVVCKLERK